MFKHMISLSYALFLLGSTGFAASKSAQIKEAVDAMRPLAQSGVKTYKIEAQNSVKAALLELAFKTDYISEKSEFSWVGNSSSAWDADSTHWGQTSMKGAYDYVTTLDKEALENMTTGEKLKFHRNLIRAKAAFKDLVGTGVQFGVAPMGAVQCGVTFAALAIIDPHSGKIYIFSKEGSGC